MSHDQMDLGDQGNTPAAVQDLARLWACRLLLNGRGYRALGTRRPDAPACPRRSRGRANALFGEEPFFGR